GAFAEARAICEAALKRDSNDVEALFLLANALARMGDSKAALPVLERARALEPGNVLVLNSLGGVYGASGRHSEAIATLRQASCIDPSFPWVQQNLGVALKAIGDFQAAKRCFERTLKTIPNFPEALVGLAEIAQIENREDQAECLSGQALAIAPDLVAAKLV